MKTGLSISLLSSKSCNMKNMSHKVQQLFCRIFASYNPMGLLCFYRSKICKSRTYLMTLKACRVQYRQCAYRFAKHTYCDLALQNFNDNLNNAMENMQKQRNKNNAYNNNSRLKLNAYICFI